MPAGSLIEYYRKMKISRLKGAAFKEKIRRGKRPWKYPLFKCFIHAVERFIQGAGLFGGMIGEVRRQGFSGNRESYRRDRKYVPGGRETGTGISYLEAKKRPNRNHKKIES